MSLRFDISCWCGDTFAGDTEEQAKRLYVEHSEARHPLSTQVDLLNALGHPWEQDRAYNEWQQASRQTHGPGCVLCAEGRRPADHNLGDS